MATAKKRPAAKPAVKKSAAKKVARARKPAVEKPWDACTLAGFGIGTEEYLESQKRKPGRYEDYSV